MKQKLGVKLTARRTPKLLRHKDEMKEEDGKNSCLQSLGRVDLAEAPLDLHDNAAAPLVKIRLIPSQIGRQWGFAASS